MCNEAQLRPAHDRDHADDPDDRIDERRLVTEISTPTVTMCNERYRLEALALRTSAPSRTMSSQFGQTRTVDIPGGANTRT